MARTLCRRCVVAITLVVIGGHPSARAQHSARAEVERPLPARAPLDATASGTRIEIDPRSSEPARELLSRAPGARALGAGGEGHYLGASLRGAELSHTTVMLGELPLTGPDAGSFDLGALDLHVLGALEVYRGGAPAILGEGPIGGVIRLVPSSIEGTRLGAAISYGSFHSGAARVWALARARAVRWTAMLSGDSSDNDYPFVDDGSTRFEPRDDREVLRRNARTLGGHGLLHLEVPLPAGTIESVVLWTSRQAGVPGPGNRQARDARRALDRYAGSVSYRLEETVEGHRLRLEALLGGWYGRHRFLDRWNEIATGIHDTDDRQHRVLGRLVGTWSPLPFLTAGALVIARRDTFEPEDLLQPVRVGDSHRDAVVASVFGVIEPRIDDVRIEIRPSARLEWSRARLETTALFGDRSVEPEVLAPTARLGAAIAPAAGLSFSASIANGTRLPSMLELFGDRVTLLPNVDLAPETATSIDAGLVVQQSLLAGDLVLDGELRGFISFYDNLIRYRRTAQYTAIAENVAHARIAGAEAGLDVRLLRHVRAEGSATFLDARDDLERALPLRPAWQGYGRFTLSTADWLAPDVVVSAHLAASHTGANSADAANLVIVPERTWLDVGARVEVFGGLVGVSFDVRDLMDVRGQDFLGFPLSGRRLSAQLDIQGEME